MFNKRIIIVLRFACIFKSENLFISTDNIEVSTINCKLFQVLFIIAHHSWGQYYNIDQSSTTKTLSYNSFFERDDFNPYIFDAYDPQMAGTYHALLKIYQNYLINGTRHSPKGIDANFEADLFWKTLKLAAAYLKYEHYRGKNSSLNFTGGAKSSESKPLDGDILLSEMYQYYTHLATERNKSKNESNFTPIFRTRKSLAEEIKGVFSKSASYLQRWWMDTKLFCVKIGQSIRRVKRIGATFVNFLLHLTKRLLRGPFGRNSSYALGYQSNITEALLNQGDGPEILFQKMS